MTANSIATYPLRLPRSIRAAVEQYSKQDGTSINQFVNTAVAEKLAALVKLLVSMLQRCQLIRFDPARDHIG